MTLHVDLVSPERILYSGEADLVIARTVGGGDIAFLGGHAPFVGALDIATVTIRKDGTLHDDPAGPMDHVRLRTRHWGRPFRHGAAGAVPPPGDDG